MYDTIIANGKVVTDARVLEADIAIRDGRIAAIGKGLEGQARTVLDATDRVILPGGVDSHVHLNDPGYTWREDFPHGSAAAAVGGITTIVDMPLQNDPTVTDARILEDKKAYVKGRSATDYALWGGLVDDNADELENMRKAGAAAFKVFIAPVSSDYSALSMGKVRRALKRIKPLNGLAGFHCEDYSIISEETARVEKLEHPTRQDFLESRPLSAEIIATRSIVELARETGARAHICHVSHPDVARIIREARREGVNVSAETCAHYLLFSEEDVLREGSPFKCAPPLRSPKAREALWSYLLDGTLGSVVSDHSPCRADEKDEASHGIMNAFGGIVGIQSVWQVMIDAARRRGLPYTLLARALSSATADRFGLGHVKGHIAVGHDADLVLVDPEREWEITAASLKYLNPHSAWVGRRGKGAPICTLVRGQVVALNGDIVNAGLGRFVAPRHA